MGAVQGFGRWLLPVPGQGLDGPRVQRRAGLVGVALAATVLAVTLGAVLSLVLRTGSVAQITGPGVGFLIAVGVAFAAVACWAPPALFRVRSRVSTQRLLSRPSSSLRRWSQATVAIDPLIPAVMVAAVYFAGDFTLAVLGVLLMARAAIEIGRQGRGQAQAPYAAVMRMGAAFLSVCACVAIVSPLSGEILMDREITAFALAAVAVLLVQSAMSVVGRWVRSDEASWAIARDILDPRRWIIVSVSAGICWAAVWLAEAVTAMDIPLSSDAGSIVGLLVLVLSWLAIWIASLLVWRAEADRIMAMWLMHQGRVIQRLHEGSADPALAARAALATCSRMAISAFGAYGVVIRLADGTVTSACVDDRATADAAGLLQLPFERIPLGADPLSPPVGEVLVVWANAPGRFTLRHRPVVQAFRDLALVCLLTSPVPPSDSVPGAPTALPTPSPAAPVPPADARLASTAQAADTWDSTASLAADLRSARESGAVGIVTAPIIDLQHRAELGSLVGLAWDYRIGGEDLRDPRAFMSVVGESVHVAAEAVQALLEAAGAVLDECDAATRHVLVPMPPILLSADSGALALPNLLAGVDRRSAGRTVLLFDRVPDGAGQALRLLADLGFGIALGADAATIDSAELQGWRRWAVVLDVVDGAVPDLVLVHQTLSTIASSDSQIVGRLSGPVDPALLIEGPFTALVDSRRGVDVPGRDHRVRV